MVLFIANILPSGNKLKNFKYNFQKIAKEVIEYEQYEADDKSKDHGKSMILNNSNSGSNGSKGQTRNHVPEHYQKIFDKIEEFASKMEKYSGKKQLPDILEMELDDLNILLAPILEKEKTAVQDLFPKNSVLGLLVNQPPKK